MSSVPVVIVEEKSTARAAYIAFDKSLSKSFGDLVVLDNVSFFVLPRPDETLCIFGRAASVSRFRCRR